MSSSSPAGAMPKGGDRTSQASLTGSPQTLAPPVVCIRKTGPINGDRTALTQFDKKHEKFFIKFL